MLSDMHANIIRWMSTNACPFPSIKYEHVNRVWFLHIIGQQERDQMRVCQYVESEMQTVADVRYIRNAALV